MSADTVGFLPYISIPDGRHSHHGRGRRGIHDSDGGFKCIYCRAYVHSIPVLSGVQNRNHCPYCLWSRHLDLSRAGDRLSACKATMQPIGLTVKRGRDKYGFDRVGEIMIIHRCSECSRLSINRIAADDTVDGLMTVLDDSSNLDLCTLHRLDSAGIFLLTAEDTRVVIGQVYGNVQY